MLYLKSFQGNMSNPNEEIYKSGEEMKQPPQIPNRDFKGKPNFEK